MAGPRLNRSYDVMLTFFEIKTPRDMLEKASREEQRLCQRVDIDNVFNFAVTAYHVYDYTKLHRPDLQAALEAFAKDQDIRDCQALCHHAKHLKLTKIPQPSTRVASNHIGVGMVGEMLVGAGDTWMMAFDGHSTDVVDLAKRVMKKWNGFFSLHSI